VRSSPASKMPQASVSSSAVAAHQASASPRGWRPMAGGVLLTLSATLCCPGRGSAALKQKAAWFLSLSPTSAGIKQGCRWPVFLLFGARDGHGSWWRVPVFLGRPWAGRSGRWAAHGPLGDRATGSFRPPPNLRRAWRQRGPPGPAAVAASGAPCSPPVPALIAVALSGGGPTILAW